ncbi:hypothetical protein PNI0010_00379 [Streptococcus pneumoniae PNI0010]|nr:hypothetical protein PCS125219_01959 [Streptococcus pneumoniae PCS125219]ELU62120.1 hypothetical protein PCS81218_02219 [Streptococcus pneumoniae PCS81218]ELU68124.1 hypothetical protein PNI0006_00173 [Streptococcus pneumoniae PNI0006]ELU77728.1 hypothetical protein PNI0010_00379 [Streptococcus pneumoniae PNI0010]
MTSFFKSQYISLFSTTRKRLIIDQPLFLDTVQVQTILYRKVR